MGLFWIALQSVTHKPLSCKNEMKDTFKGKKEKEKNSLVLFLCGRGNSNS